MARKKFLRQEIRRLLRIGKKRKKKQKWRAPKGRHSKIRKKRKGYPLKVEIGFKKLKQRKNEKIIDSMNELKNINKNNLLILSSKIGKKKRIEIAKKAIETKIKFVNFNPEKFLKKVEEKKNETR